VPGSLQGVWAFLSVSPTQASCSAFYKALASVKHCGNSRDSAASSLQLGPHLAVSWAPPVSPPPGPPQHHTWPCWPSHGVLGQCCRRAAHTSDSMLRKYVQSLLWCQRSGHQLQEIRRAASHTTPTPRRLQLPQPPGNTLCRCFHLPARLGALPRSCCLLAACSPCAGIRVPTATATAATAAAAAVACPYAVNLAARRCCCCWWRRYKCCRCA
jgi:hypothetical protein